MARVKAHWIGLGVLLLFVCLVYSAVSDFDFVRWDDNVHVYQNPHFPPKSLADFTVFWRAPFVQVYVPVDFTIWGAVASFSQEATPKAALPLDFTTLKPGPFHLLNLAAHLIITVMVFLLLRRLKISGSGSLAGAAIFALHPVQVESVAWVTGFKEISSAFFGVAALLFQARAMEISSVESGENRKAFFGFSFAATIAYVLALLSLPSAVGLALAAILIWSRKDGKFVRTSLYAPGLWIVISLGVIWYNKTANILDADMVVAPAWARFALAGDSLAFYSSKFLWPFNFGIDYGHTPNWVMSQPGYLALSLVFFIFAGLIAFFWKQEKRAAAALGLFFFSLLPTMGFVPFVYQMYSTVADRYAYCAVLGLAVAAGLGFDFLRRQGRVGAYVALLGAVGCGLFLGYQTTVQNVFWRDSRSLFEHAVSINPNSWAHHNNLGLLLLDIGANEAAETQLKESLRANPKYPQAWLNLGSASLRMNKYTQARDCFEKVIKYRPEIADGYYNLAIIYYGIGKKAKASQLLDQALVRQPGWSMALELREKVRQLPNP